ncbi:MAG: tetratricopeptide repeat protein [Calditrichia bacterium]
MGRNLYFVLVLVVSFSFLISKSPAQTPQDTTELKSLISHLSELEFQVALNAYVEKLFVNYGIENLPREKFLVSLMRLVNNEMNKRITNPRAARDKYFNELENQLVELRTLKSRLNTSGIKELNSFIKELENRLKLTIRNGQVDYKKKKVFEDAIQLLYVAEEMIKMDRLRDPGNLNKNILSSKDKLLHAFGEVGETENIPLDVEPTIFNLFEEWKKTDLYQYDARLLDVKVARNKLIRSGNIQTTQRMFNEQLKYAYTLFNYYEYDQVDRLLEDLVNTYSKADVKDFDDVYYYWAESDYALGRLMRARGIYKRLLDEYPQSSYLPATYSRLIEISYKLKEPDEVLTYFSNYRNVASPSDKRFYDMHFIAALTLYQESNYSQAVDILMSFPKGNPYYYFAQYMTGIIYAAGQNYDMARNVFETLIQSRETPADIHNRAIYKLALISYEQGAYQSAISYLNALPSDFYRYDKVLNALAWSHFMMAQSSMDSTGQQNFTQAANYARMLADNYYASEYRMEAESLLGYINQLQDQPTAALSLYRDVYESKVKKKDINDFLAERDSLENLYDQARKMEEKALEANNSEAYVKASDVADNLHTQILQMDLAELSPVGSDVTQEVYDLLSQLDQVEELRKQARAAGNKSAIAKADSMMIRLSSLLEELPKDYLRTAVAYNWFDAYPVSRKVADYEFSTAKERRIREEILNEMNRINGQVAQFYQQIERKKLEGDYKAVVALEQKVEHLKEIGKEYDQLYADAFKLNPGQPYNDFDKWGDFGAFGIIDVNFGERSRLQNRMADVSTLYNSVVGLISEKREVVEDKLKKIEAEIRFMTMKARLEERQRLRAERERAFRETYFDKRTSEFEER